MLGESILLFQKHLDLFPGYQFCYLPPFGDWIMTVYAGVSSSLNGYSIV